MDLKSPIRPQHRRNASSKTGIWKSLVSTKAQPDSADAESGPVKRHARTQSVPLLPPDHPHASGGGILGERQLNAQARLPGDKKTSTKSPTKHVASSTTPKKKTTEHNESPKKTKSSTNLSSVFARMNRSQKDITVGATKDKENTTPPVTSHDFRAETPIWAQFATTSDTNLEQPAKENSQPGDLEQEIARYTPQEYSPGKQRNFVGSFDQPSLRPSLSSSRPPSGYNLLASDGIVGAIGRRVSGGKASLDIRRSGEAARDQGRDTGRRVSGERIAMMKHNSTERKVSGSSAEQSPLKDKLNIVKRGGRVMAAVAALQGKPKEAPPTKDDLPLDAKAVDEAFEAVLAARNIPEPMRQKMRTLTLRVKADFVKQDQGQSKTPGISNSAESSTTIQTTTADTEVPEEAAKRHEKEAKSSKRSRARSRTFTFSKGDKRSSNSPTKRQRSGSKSRPQSIHISGEPTVRSPSTPTTPTDSLGRQIGAPAVPATYITYLQKTQDPVSVEVGRLHKLRILLRNETVTWVNAFVSQGGMTEVVGLLNRTMAIEWREDHEDQVLHEALLCLKALCTAECAMVELAKVADDLFPALLGMLFDDEKKGPAEYTTRTIITNVLFNFLASSTNSSTEALEARARQILRYLGEPPKPNDARPVEFVLGMHVPRPYKLWCREITHVTKEVFWIFLHHLNVVPQPKPSSAGGEAPEEPAELAMQTYAARHFPGSRAPVPAAPYVGGVEWEATTYMIAHLDLLNGLLASIPGTVARNELRMQLQMSGFEKVMGGTLRTCKEKFYSGVHDALRVWVAAALEDGWDTQYVREGPSEDERAEKALKASPKKSPNKKREPAPKLEALPVQTPEFQLDLHLDMSNDTACNDEDDNGWIG